MTEENITKSRLIDALNARILNKFRKGFNEELQKLLDNPSELSQSYNRIFVHTVHGIKLTDGLLMEIRSILLNEFGFTIDDVHNITMSSDDDPCLIVDFSLTED